MVPASTNQTTSHLGDVAPTLLATVNVEETHLIYARDKYMNLQNDMLDVFTVRLTHKLNVVNGVVTKVSNGIYQVKYTLLVAGGWNLEILVQPGGGSGPFYPIKDSGQTVIC